MPRIARLVVQNETAVYHVMSRTALDGYPFKDADKEVFVRILRKYSRFYFTEILGFCVMGNHFHLVVRMRPARSFTDEQIQQRHTEFYGEDRAPLSADQIPLLRMKLESLSDFMKAVKHAFSLYYNRHHGRQGTLWAERFKSLIVEEGQTLVNCLAYVDLNPLRAGLVERPEDYRWNSLGYHIQSGNRGGFLSLDLGLVEFGVLDAKERLRRYRRYVYECGAVPRPQKAEAAAIDQKTLEAERNGDFKLSRIRRFRYRTRYFSDSGIIGTKAFVANHYQQFKHVFISKKEKVPKPIKGLDGIYSLKRLSGET